MPAKRRLTMRQLRQMLRLAGSGTSSREIAVVLGIARSTVQDNLRRAAAIGLSWPLLGELTDDALEKNSSLAMASNRARGGAQSRTGPILPSSSRSRASRSSSCGRSIEEVIPTDMAIAGSASSFAASNSGFRRRCAKNTSPATRSSSTIPARLRKLETTSPADLPGSTKRANRHRISRALASAGLLHVALCADSHCDLLRLFRYSSQQPARK